MKSKNLNINEDDFLEYSDALAKLKYEQYAFGVDHSAEIKRIQDLIGITDDLEWEDEDL